MNRPGEQVGQRRVALPIEDQARQQIGPAQERRVGGHGAAEHDVIAAAGAGVAPVGHELVGAEPRLARVLVERGRRLHRLAPGRGGMDVDLDHAGIGRHLDAVDARIERRRVALDADRHVSLARDRFDCGEQLEIIVELRRRRHEDAQHAVARLDGERRAHRAFGGELFVLGLLLRAGQFRRGLAELHRLGQFAARVQRVLLVNERESPKA